MAYGLAAHPLVRWLISSDLGVYEAVQTFIAGAGRDYVDVAGPPIKADRIKFAGKAEACPLPVVRLKMKMARKALTGEMGVEVSCSDEDLLELDRWCREASHKLRKAQ